MKSNTHYVNTIYLSNFIALFKLKAHNLLFWLAAPTLGARAYYDCHIHERIDNLWRIHINREKQGNESINQQLVLFQVEQLNIIIISLFIVT